MNGDSLSALEAQLSEAVAQAGSVEQLDAVQREYLGKKSALKAAFKDIGKLPAEERGAFAQRLNSLQQQFEATIEARRAAIARAELDARLANEWIDLSMPATAARRGALHPVTILENRCLEILRRLGFSLVEGPEVETNFYNFDALNIPKHHPARDMQDTFFVGPEHLLRSHTTTVQARVLEQHRPLPIKVASAGRVYRNEATDATHLPMFHQLEGFWVDKDLRFSDLKGILAFVVRELFGADQAFRFKPKFYPYTEPSVGMDLRCTSCQGAGCAACHGAGWVTVIGAGMIHRNVFTTFGYDPDTVSGIAFGWGTTRMASQWIGVKHIKALYSQDLRLLQAIHRRQW